MSGVIGGIEAEGEGDPVDGRGEPEPPLPSLPSPLLVLLVFTTGGGPATPAVAEAASRLALTLFRRELSMAAETLPLGESSSSNLTVLPFLGSGGTSAEPPESPEDVCLSDALALGRRERLRRSATRASASARSSSVTFVMCTSRSGSSYSYTVGAAPGDDADEEDVGGRWVCGGDGGRTTTTPTLTRT